MPPENHSVKIIFLLFKSHTIIFSLIIIFMKIKNPSLLQIGINHNGDIDIAKNLIVNAKAGFDSVKFQKRTIDNVIQKTSLIKKGKSLGTTQREQRRFGV